MFRNNIFYLIVLAAFIFCGGCTNTRYLTDPLSIGRQHDMKKHRVGTNAGQVGLNLINLILSETINTEYAISKGDRAFKKISIVNPSSDSLFVNMVTDVLWKETGYCDIMGIVLPPGSKQKLLVPYPAAYNVYFRTPSTEEEKLEIRTDSKYRRFELRTGMTKWLSTE